MSYMDELNFWLNDDYFDQKTKDELLAIKNPSVLCIPGRSCR